MSPAPDPEEQPPAADELSEAERRRRRARVFGDVLPDGTRDEQADGWSEREPPRAATSGSGVRSPRTTAEPRGLLARQVGDVGDEVEHELDGVQDAEHGDHDDRHSRPDPHLFLREAGPVRHGTDDLSGAAG